MDAEKMEALDGLVTEVDGESPEAQAQQQAEVQAQLDADAQARGWGVIMWTVGSALAMVAPELRQVYTDDACLNWGRSVVPVAEKYGWSGPANVPELGLLISTAGLAVPSYLVIKAKLAAMREAREAAERARKAAAAEGQGDGG
jgi:hypothetical protein